MCIVLWGHACHEEAWRSENNTVMTLSFHLYMDLGEGTLVTRFMRVPFPPKASCGLPPFAST